MCKAIRAVEICPQLVWKSFKTGENPEHAGARAHIRTSLSTGGGVGEKDFKTDDPTELQIELLSPLIINV